MGTKNDDSDKVVSFEAHGERLYAVFANGRKRWATVAEEAEAAQQGLWTPPDVPKSTGTVVEHEREDKNPLPDFNPPALGAIWQGFFESMRGEVDEEELSGDDLLPWLVVEDRAREAEPWRKHYREHLELGRELYDVLPLVADRLGVTEAEFIAAISGGERTLPNGAAQRQPGDYVWIPPVTGRVSQVFGGSHRGIDIAVASGTPVRAPRRMVIDKVGRDDVAGLHVIATIDEGAGYFDDSEWRLTFAHLSTVDVTEGATVEQGQTFAQSGNSGRVRGSNGGAHLHWRVEYYKDNTFPFFDDRKAIDPFALVPRSAIESGIPQPPPGEPVESLPRSSASDQSAGLIIVAPNGQVSIGGHGVINPKTDIDTTIDDLGISLSSHVVEQPTVLEELGVVDAPRPPVRVATRKPKRGTGARGATAGDVAVSVVDSLLAPESITAAAGLLAASAPLLAFIPTAGPVLAPAAAIGGAALGIVGPGVAQAAAPAVSAGVSAGVDILDDILA